MTVYWCCWRRLCYVLKWNVITAAIHNQVKQMFKRCNFNEVQSCNDMMEAVPSLFTWLNRLLFTHKIMTEPCWTYSSLICDDFQKYRASLSLRVDRITVPKHSLFCHLQNYGPISVFPSCERHFRLVIFLSTATFHVCRFLLGCGWSTSVGLNSCYISYQ